MKKYDFYVKHCDSIEEEISQHRNFLMRQIITTRESSIDENDSVAREDNENDSSDISRRSTVNINHLNSNININGNENDSVDKINVSASETHTHTKP